MAKCDEASSPTVIESMHKEFVDGIMYQPMWSPIPVSEILKKMKTLEILPDDVVINGIQRSGNHLAMELVHMARNQTTEFSKDNFMQHTVDSRLCMDQMGLEAFPPPRTLMSHVRMDKLPAQIVEKRTKVIYLLRNPKDAIASLFFVWSQLKDEKERFAGTQEEFMDVYLQGYVPYGNWFDHVLAMEKFMEDNPQVPVHIHSLEDMVKNPVESVTSLCKFLEAPTDMAEAIAETTRFAKMKRNSTKHKKFDEAFFKPKESASMLRKGVIGDWKNFFTEDQNKAVDEMYRSKMSNSKLARLVDEYMDL